MEGGSSPTSKQRASMASWMSSGIGAWQENTSRVGIWALNSRREVPGPRRRMRTQSNTAFRARVISGAQGTSRKNRGWRCVRVTCSLILRVLNRQPGKGQGESLVPRCGGRRYLAPSGRACSPRSRGGSSGGSLGCSGRSGLQRSFAHPQVGE